MAGFYTFYAEKVRKQKGNGLIFKLWSVLEGGREGIGKT